VGGDPKLARDDLRVGRLVPLSLRLGAEPADAASRRVNADLGGVEHRNAENVAGARRTRTDNLGEEGDADPHQRTSLAAPEGFPLGLLLLAQLLVANRVER